MSGNRFNAHADLELGLGLRSPHIDHILSHKPDVSWFEIISENYMVDGGQPLHLLDVNNIYVSSVNHGFDPMTCLENLPHERVAQIHIAGHSRHERFVIDTHDHPVIDPVWKLYARAIELCGPTPTLLEWDARIPPFEEVQAEALKASRYWSHVSRRPEAALRREVADAG